MDVFHSLLSGVALLVRHFCYWAGLRHSRPPSLQRDVWLISSCLSEIGITYPVSDTTLYSLQIPVRFKLRPFIGDKSSQWGRISYIWDKRIGNVVIYGRRDFQWIRGKKKKLANYLHTSMDSLLIPASAACRHVRVSRDALLSIQLRKELSRRAGTGWASLPYSCEPWKVIVCGSNRPFGGVDSGRSGETRVPLSVLVRITRVDVSHMRLGRGQTLNAPKKYNFEIFFLKKNATYSAGFRIHSLDYRTWSWRFCAIWITLHANILMFVLVPSHSIPVAVGVIRHDWTLSYLVIFFDQQHKQKLASAGPLA
jgi:hypothetical protein